MKSCKLLFYLFYGYNASIVCLTCPCLVLSKWGGVGYMPIQSNDPSIQYEQEIRSAHQFQHNTIHVMYFIMHRLYSIVRLISIHMFKDFYRKNIKVETFC